MSLQRLLSWGKVGLLKVVDLLDHQPWDEFTRLLEVKTVETLEYKSRKFQVDLFANFLELDGTIIQYKENVPRDANIDTGDQCLWHGIGVAMLAIKYSVTKSPSDDIDLLAGLSGMNRHYRNFKLVRGIKADGTIQDDVSNDQLSGHLCGLYFAWKYGSDTAAYHAGVLLHLIADELISNNYSLVNQDGTPTTYGQLEQGWKTDPLRITLLLALLKFASVAAHNPDESRSIYGAHYMMLMEKYYPLIKYPKVRFWSLDTQYDTHRAAIHLSILADLESGDVKHRACEGLLRIWKMVRRSANPWVYFLVRRQLLVDPADLDNCLKHLYEFTLEDKHDVVQRNNSSDPQLATVKWGGNVRALQPLPRWKVGSQDFFWQRHLYSVDDWQGQTTPSIAHTGLDFLIAYWGFRNLNLINGDM